MNKIYTIRDCVVTRRIACAVICTVMSSAGVTAAETVAQNNSRNSSDNANSLDHQYEMDNGNPAAATLKKASNEHSRSQGKHPKYEDHKKLCDEVAKELRRIRSPHQANDLYIDSIELGGRYWKYVGVDLDGDGEADGLTEGCGSPSDGNCQLEVQLSSGGSYDFEEETFHLMRFQARYYIIVGDSYPPENFGKRRLYIVSKTAPVLVCTSL